MILFIFNTSELRLCMTCSDSNDALCKLRFEIWDLQETRDFSNKEMPIVLNVEDSTIVRLLLETLH